MRKMYTSLRDSIAHKKNDLTAKLKADEDSYKKAAAETATKSASGKASKPEVIDLFFDDCAFSIESIKVLCEQIKNYRQIRMLCFRNCTFYPKGDKEQSRKSMIPVMEMLGKGISNSGVEHIYFDDKQQLVEGQASQVFAKELLPYTNLKTLAYHTGPEADNALCDVFEKGKSFITLFEMRQLNQKQEQKSDLDKALLSRLEKINPTLERRKLERPLTDDVRPYMDLFDQVVDSALPLEFRRTAVPGTLRKILEGDESGSEKPESTRGPAGPI